jgi:heat shock protein HtpX
MNTLKTTLLLTGLTVLLMIVGTILGGRGGALIALTLSVVLNFGTYWFGHKIVLSQYDAEEITEDEAPTLHRVVARLAQKANIPKPDVYLIPEQNPNAFATGRNPSNAIIGVTKGLMELLDEDELEGVLAHELSHVVNRDTLISTIAASLAGAIAYLATMARFAAIFGIGGRDRNNNILVILVMSIVAPLAATVIQLAISRSREFKADRSGAELCGKPMSLARALQKLENASQKQPMQRGSQETAHLFIVNPLSMEGLKSLFSTHPDVEDRVEELKKMARGV